MSAIEIYDIRCKSCGAPLDGDKCKYCGSIYEIRIAELEQDEPPDRQDEFNRIGELLIPIARSPSVCSAPEPHIRREKLPVGVYRGHFVESCFDCLGLPSIQHATRSDGIIGIVVGINYTLMRADVLTKGRVHGFEDIIAGRKYARNVIGVSEHELLLF